MRLTPKLDQLDYEILLALREDARMKAVLIARRTGSNERTVRNRIDRLLASGIVRLTTVMDMNACGFNITGDRIAARSTRSFRVTPCVRT